MAEALDASRESVFRRKRQAREGGTEAPRIKEAPGRPRRRRAVREVVADEHESAMAAHRGMRRPQKRPGIAQALFTGSHLAYINPYRRCLKTYRSAQYQISTHVTELPITTLQVHK
ncbi:hypothetical protein [Streptosporangium vulgare]|uniref:Uncharacterized protein n=1 Tax=Streptosporangium vulgare TaxID=46190 RepID=A0ABV5TER3_9ACTN